MMVDMTQNSTCKNSLIILTQNSLIIISVYSKQGILSACILSIMILMTRKGPLCKALGGRLMIK
jgi:hypothetical protein